MRLHVGVILIQPSSFNSAAMLRGRCLPIANGGLIGLEGEVGWLAETAATAFSAATVMLELL